MPQKKSLGTQADVGLIHQAVEFSRRGLGTSSGKTEHHKLLLHMIAGIPAADLDSTITIGDKPLPYRCHRIASPLPHSHSQ